MLIHGPLTIAIILVEQGVSQPQGDNTLIQVGQIFVKQEIILEEHSPLTPQEPEVGIQGNTGIMQPGRLGFDPVVGQPTYYAEGPAEASQGLIPDIGIEQVPVPSADSKA